jgi:signal transduction histidine kinase
MTLLRKFAVLLMVMALMVALNLGTSAWAISVLQREVSVYLSSISSVLGGLNRIKRDLADIGAMIPSSGGGEPIPWTTPPERLAVADAMERFERLAADVRASFEEVERSGTYRARAGISTTLNLHARVAQSLADSRKWFEVQDERAGESARQELFLLHELIERNESKILGDAQQAVAHSRDIRSRVIAAMLIALAVTLAAGGLGIALMRRWVVRPVTELRTAAGRIAAGDFAHRVPVHGRDELAMLSAEVNHMAGMISAMQEERVERERLAAVGEMVRRLAHNLRNPLAGIRSLAELTKGDLTGDHPAQENQDRIISTVDRFEQWLAEMLSATTPLQVEPQPAQVGSWLRAVVEPLRPLADTRGIELVVDTTAAPAEAWFDPRHLEQALVGIITNALQVSPRGERVVVVGASNGEQWEIRVEDRGPGVPPELAEKIFRPYFTTKREGTGIGLAVAKQVIEQHGGRISVRSGSRAAVDEKGGPGAVFVLRLPLRPAAGGAGGAHELARDGQVGGSGGQDPDSRGRGEPAVLHPADA